MVRIFKSFEVYSGLPQRSQRFSRSTKAVSKILHSFVFLCRRQPFLVILVKIFVNFVVKNYFNK